MKKTILCVLITVIGLAQLANGEGPPGICNGVLHSNSGYDGTFSNWIFRADGTTEGQWDMNTPCGLAVSSDANGSYTYSAGVAVATCTGTATIAGIGTDSYSMTITLTFPEGGNYASEGTYDVNFATWPDDEGTWQGIRYIAPITDHVFYIQIEQGWDHDKPDDDNDLTYEFELITATDDTVELVEFLTPAGNTFEIPNLPSQWDDVNGIWTSYEYNDEYGAWVWEYCTEFSDINDLQAYGDGWYTVTVYYQDESNDQTTVWFGIPYENNPIPQPTQEPVFTFPPHHGSVNSPVTFTWQPCTDTNATEIWIELEKGATGEEIESNDFDVSETTWGPIAMTDGFWEAKIDFDRCYTISNNGDGIEYEVSKFSESNYEFAVGRPWVGYEVWAGDTDYTGEPNWWEYYYSIDQQDYEKLGESSGQTATFSGDYTYYVIAVRQEFLLDSIRGSDGLYYQGSLWTGNTHDPENIIGAPDDQYATVGYQESGERFRGFVVITNPGDWTALTVITDQAIPGDFEPDGDVDLADFATLASAWLTEYGDARWNPDCDINIPSDDFIDTLDLAVFVENWLEGVE